jgi:hypothetical protein
MEKKNIYQKLLEIQQKINGLGKDKDTKTQYNPNGYKYVTGDKVLGEVKPLMNSLGLILKQEILSIENQRQDYATKSGQKSEILSKVMMRFTWIDCETGEKDENLFGANGQNDWEKGLGSALTYAERYFLLKFFHIATDEDDIDNADRVTKSPIAPLATTTQTNPLPYLNEGTIEWTKCVSALKGEFTILDIKKKYRITKEKEDKLINESLT